MKKPGYKLKLLKLMDIINNYTDDEHPLSSFEISEKLKEFNILSERKSIYDDIETLIGYGIDINKTTSPKRGFYLAKRDFEVSEIKLLIDIVNFSSFLSEKKSNDLIMKLKALLSNFQAELLSKIESEKINKSKNEEIYYNIYICNEAIINKNKVKFIYNKFAFDQKNIIKINNYVNIVNPIKLIFLNGDYFLIAKPDGQSCILKYRLDKIKSTNILDDKFDNLNLGNRYYKEINKNIYYNCYIKDDLNIRIIFNKEFLDEILSYFKEYLNLKCNGKFCSADVTIKQNTNALQWLMYNSNNVFVKEPLWLRNSIFNRIKEMKNFYECLLSN